MKRSGHVRCRSRCAGMRPGCSRRPGRSRGILRGPAPRRCAPHRRDVGPSLRQPPDPLRCAVVSIFGESARQRSGMFQQHARDHGQYVHSGRRADRRLHGGLWDRQAAVRDGVSQRIAGQRRVADRRHDEHRAAEQDLGVEHRRAALRMDWGLQGAPGVRQYVTTTFSTTRAGRRSPAPASAGWQRS